MFNLTVADAVLVKSDICEIGNAVLIEFETNATAFRAQVNRSQKKQTNRSGECRTENL